MDDFSIDPILGPEILDLLGVAPHQLDNPHLYRKVQEVVKYFSDRSFDKMELMRVISKYSNADKVDTAWMYVNLKKQREDAIKKLDPNDFEDDVAVEIKGGYVTQNSMKRVRDDIETWRRRQELEDIEATLDNERTNRGIKGGLDEKYASYEIALNQLEQTNQALRHYE